MYGYVYEDFEQASSYVRLEYFFFNEWVSTEKNEAGKRIAYKATTSFSKVRINVNTLQLDTGDFKFAESTTACTNDDDLVQPCQDNLYKVPLGMAGVCPFRIADDSVQIDPQVTVATTTIDLTGTGLQLTNGSIMRLTQFIDLGDLAKVIQPIADAVSVNQEFYIGASANVSTDDRISLTGTVEYGVQSNVGLDFNDVLTYINTNVVVDDSNEILSASPLSVNLSCDYLINYNWLDDVERSENYRHVPVLDTSRFRLRRVLIEWLYVFTPKSEAEYTEQLREFISGGYGICTCIEGSSNCDNLTCPWNTASDRPVSPTAPPVSPTVPPVSPTAPGSAESSSSDASESSSSTGIIVGASVGGVIFVGIIFYISSTLAKRSTPNRATLNGLL